MAKKASYNLGVRKFGKKKKKITYKMSKDWPGRMEEGVFQVKRQGC